MKKAAILLLASLLSITGCQAPKSDTSQAGQRVPSSMGVVSILDDITVKTTGVNAVWGTPTGMTFPEFGNRVNAEIGQCLELKGYSTTLVTLPEDQLKRMHDDTDPVDVFLKMLKEGIVNTEGVDAIILISPARSVDVVVREKYRNPIGAWATFYKVKSNPNRINVELCLRACAIDAKTHKILSHNISYGPSSIMLPKIQLSTPMNAAQPTDAQKTEMLEQLEGLIIKTVPILLKKVPSVAK
ncbi:hypothetical protein [Ereboglobus luteus]|nr:hypothetical protein [Ereboglobus luteus]